MDELCDFLRSRDISEETIQQLEKDKVIRLLNEMMKMNTHRKELCIF